MPRPQKGKKVCQMPRHTAFCTKEGSVEDCRVFLLVEEYEVLRLIDHLGMTQEACAKQMEVGRSTVQMLYAQARKKVARFLVEGTPLVIAGGQFSLCQQIGQCRTMECSLRAEGQENQKGEKTMIIAVTYENGQVFQHFGHTEQFKLYHVENGTVVSSEVISTNGSGHGALAGFLKQKGVNTLICGGIGGGARNALAAEMIEIYPGAAGDADAQVEALLKGTLAYDPNTMCNHHHDHGEGHSCGSHGCGSH